MSREWVPLWKREGVLPRGDVVVLPMHTPDEPLSCVSAAAQDEDGRGQLVGGNRRQLLGSELPERKISVVDATHTSVRVLTSFHHQRKGRSFPLEIPGSTGAAKGSTNGVPDTTPQDLGDKRVLMRIVDACRDVSAGSSAHGEPIAEEPLYPTPPPANVIMLQEVTREAFYGGEPRRGWKAEYEDVMLATSLPVVRPRIIHFAETAGQRTAITRDTFLNVPRRPGTGRNAVKSPTRKTHNHQIQTRLHPARIRTTRSVQPKTPARKNILGNQR